MSGAVASESFRLRQMAAGFELKVRKKRAALFALLDVLASDDAVVSFEGNLKHMKIDQGLRASEMPLVKRNTRAPVLDFIILRLEPESLSKIKQALSSVSVVHVQVERNGRLLFGAYDGLQHVWISAEVGALVLDDLVKRGLLWSYAVTGA